MAVAGSMSYSSGRMYAKPSDQRLQSIGIDVLCSPVSGHTAWPARGRSLSLLVSMMRGSGRLKVAISTAKMYAKQFDLACAEGSRALGPVNICRFWQWFGTLAHWNTLKRGKLDNGLIVDESLLDKLNGPLLMDR